MERYTAFTRRFFGSRKFRAEPWQHAAVEVEVTHDNLATAGESWRTAAHAGANHLPGVDVWMGRPLRVG